MKERIHAVLQLEEATPKDAKEIIHIHNELFGKELSICPTCPGQLRHAVRRLSNYYKTEYEESTK